MTYLLDTAHRDFRARTDIIFFAVDLEGIQAERVRPMRRIDPDLPSTSRSVFRLPNDVGIGRAAVSNATSTPSEIRNNVDSFDDASSSASHSSRSVPLLVSFFVALLSLIVL